MAAAAAVTSLFKVLGLHLYKYSCTWTLRLAVPILVGMLTKAQITYCTHLTTKVLLNGTLERRKHQPTIHLPFESATVFQD